MKQNRDHKKVYLYSLIVLVGLLLLLVGFGWFKLTGLFLVIALVTASLFLLAFFRLDWLLFLVILSLVFNRWLLLYQIDFSFLATFLGVKELLVSPYTLLYGLVIFIFLVEFLSAPSKMIKAPLFWPIVLAVIINGLSFLNSDYKIDGINDWLYFLGFFAAYFLGFRRFNSPRDFLRLLVWVVFVSAVPLFFTFQQLVLGDFFYEGDSSLPRLVGSFFHPNTLGSFFLVAVTICWALFLAQWENGSGQKISRAGRIFFVILIPLLLGLAFTFSRSSWIGAVMALSVISLSRPWFRRLFFVGAFLLVAIVFLVTPLRERVTDVFQPQMFDTLHARFEIWDWALYAFRERPWTGYGFGSFEGVVQDVRGYDSGNAYPHSDTVLFLTERGILGFVGYLLYMLGALFYAFRGRLSSALRKRRYSIIKKSHPWDFKVIGSVPLALFLAMALVSLVESPVRDFTFQFLSWILLGSFLGFTSKNKKKAVPANSDSPPVEAE